MLLGEQLMNQCYTKDGYAQVTLKQFGRRGTFYVHRLVLIAFDIEPPTPEHTQANHKDQNPKNNRLDNLEWVTPQENKEYGNRYETLMRIMLLFAATHTHWRNQCLICLSPDYSARARFIINIGLTRAQMKLLVSALQ